MKTEIYKPSGRHVVLKACLLLMVIMGTIISCVVAESNSDGGLLPAKIVFKEDNYDFGDIREGIKVEHIFKFTNEGEDTLRIKRVQAG